MLYQRQLNQQQNKRKSREGDWVCIQCFNYNYAFRNNCNRCHSQQRNQNQRLLNAIGNENYGQNSFPSVVFLQYQENDSKQNLFQPSNIIPRNNSVYKSKNLKEFNTKQVGDQTEPILTQNIWISNLIDE